MKLELSGPILILGAGKMGGALLSGLLSRGLQPADVLVQDPAPPAETASIIAAHAIGQAASFDKLETPPSVILAAVKPQVMDDVFPSAARHAGPHTLSLSIAAGRTIASFAKYLPAGSAIVRAMPNTPAAIGHGMTVCCASADVSAGQKELATRLMSAVGKVAWIDDEALMDAVTAVSGSGPAYAFHLVECMAEAGVAAGLDPDLSAELARATVAGSGALLDHSDKPAGELRRNVTSPGGTTAAALDVLMEDDVMRRLFVRAIAAAKKRGEELSGN
ncbi:MAG: pyrroline-5-carboxylate reductase [Alphaproteobacteria bacterium BRH_c36]|nr:MAG: pyrroline-5-carboxylate reductase [Alphaproteobacteria bacterium BRH_c36]